MKTINWLLEQMLVNNYISRKGYENANTWLIQEAIQDDIKEKNDFAIGFAEWLIKRETKYFESLKELLEIYKKEKGL
jgi:hypothetical protein